LKIIKYSSFYYFNIAKEIVHSCYNKKKINIFISGGRTIEKVLKNFGKICKVKIKVNFYLVDERITFNSKLTNKYKLDKVISFKNNLIKCNVFSLENSLNTNADIKNYLKKMSNIKFDLSIISLAKDGHVASIEYQNISDRKFNNKNYQVIDNFIKKPKKRFTLTLKKISSAKDCWLLIDNKKKFTFFKKNNLRRYFSKFSIYTK